MYLALRIGDAAVWAGFAMALPQFWLDGPQCSWPHPGPDLAPGLPQIVPPTEHLQPKDVYFTL